jgi:Glu-tRNA(Gln) amidotransferase subunit E-like FAD-binding protein
MSAISINIQWHYALNLSEESDAAKYICLKTLWTLRSILTENSIDADIFDAVRNKLANVFKVNTDNQRIDSVHIKSNMRKLGRIGIFVSGISKFLRNLKRNHRGRFDTIENDLKIKYLSKNCKRSFSVIKPSDSHKTLSEVSNDLYGLVEQFKDSSDVNGMDSYKLLVRILNEQCNVADSGKEPQVEVMKPKDIPSDFLRFTPESF